VAGLTDAQWAVLRYFSQANRFSRTPSAFAAFHSTTRGTASQTIKNLISQGYLTSIRSDSDRRSVRLILTDKAWEILKKDPIESLVRATESLPQGVQGDFADTLQYILNQVAQERDKPHFGTCTSCEHLENDGCTQAGKSPYECKLTSEPLLLDELDEVCINFVPGKPMVDKGPITRAK
jgi:DNA-binding MarR family transcriptional regulator